MPFSLGKLTERKEKKGKSAKDMEKQLFGFLICNIPMCILLLRGKKNTKPVWESIFHM